MLSIVGSTLTTDIICYPTYDPVDRLNVDFSSTGVLHAVRVAPPGSYRIELTFMNRDEASIDEIVAFYQVNADNDVTFNILATNDTFVGRFTRPPTPAYRAFGMYKVTMSLAGKRI